MFFIETYRTIAHDARAEIVIKKSQFIGQLFRVTSEEAAQAAIAEVRQVEAKANHHCFAYQLGAHHDIQRSSDDGEPAGTAGAPILNVLQQEDLRDTLCVVTRYFGGIKLGAGGLIRAYGQATTAALHAAGLVQAVPQQAYHLTIAYDQYDLLRHFLEQQHLSSETPIYGADIKLIVWLDQATSDQQLTGIKNLLSGRVTIVAGAKAFREVSLSE